MRAVGNAWLGAIALSGALMSRDVLGRPLPNHERRYFRDPKLDEEAKAKAEAKRQRKAAKRLASEEGQ